MLNARKRGNTYDNTVLEFSRVLTCGTTDSYIKSTLLVSEKKR